MREQLVRIRISLDAHWYTLKKMLSLLRGVFSRLRQGYPLNGAIICAIEEEERKHQEEVARLLEEISLLKEELGGFLIRTQKTKGGKGCKE